MSRQRNPPFFFNLSKAAKISMSHLSCEPFIQPQRGVGTTPKSLLSSQSVLMTLLTPLGQEDTLNYQQVL